MWERVPDDVNPYVYVLWLLRSGRVTGWRSLAHEFGFDPSFVGTLENELLHRLALMRDAGLIRMVEGKDRGTYDLVPSRIELTDKWNDLQSALDISLTELTKLGSSAIIVSPYFGKPERDATGADILVLMPFDEDLRPVYEDHIAACARDLGLTLARGDDFFTSRSVMADVWAALLSARAVIADCTGRNPNVFYEMGLAHAVGKPVILVTQSSDDVPFDIRHLRYIQYDFTPRGMGIFEKRVKDTLTTELQLQASNVRFRVAWIVADESDGSRARLHDEFRAIETALGADKFGAEFPWSQHYLPDISRAIGNADQAPRILHVTGHTDGPDAVMVSDQDEPRPQEPAALGAALRPVADELECVILSGCFDEKQAATIATEIPNLIGIHARLGARATSFVVDFYTSLSAGRSVPEAHEIASNRVRLEGVAEDSLPELMRR